MVPTDGSEHALLAVEEVVRLAPQLTQPVEVLLLNVQPPVPAKFLLLGEGTPSDKRELEEPLREAGEETLQPARALLERAKITHACHVEIGHPAETIAKFALTFHCEMIVMATRGLNAGSGLLLGSVATKVVHLADIPVLLVH
jgi:nucleotide-binding universal stress UspA family protein